MCDHFDMPDANYDDEQKEREEAAYEIAVYIDKHPAPNHPLAKRVEVLTQVGEPELSRLLIEVEYWLDLFEWQRKDR